MVCGHSPLRIYGIRLDYIEQPNAMQFFKTVSLIMAAMFIIFVLTSIPFAIALCLSRISSLLIYFIIIISLVSYVMFSPSTDTRMSSPGEPLGRFILTVILLVGGISGVAARGVYLGWQHYRSKQKLRC